MTQSVESLISLVLLGVLTAALWWWYFDLKKELRKRGHNMRYPFKTTLICTIACTICFIGALVDFMAGGDSGPTQSVYSDSGVHSGGS